jgi:hypothetical protein
MADTDYASYILRYNLITRAPEYFTGADWYSVTLPPGDLPLTNGHIFVGNAGGFAVDVAVSGDATLANTGVLTLANTAVSAASYTYASITVDSKGRLTAASSATAGTSGFVVTSNGSTLSSKPSGIGNIITTANSGTITPDASLGNTFYTAVSNTVTMNGPSNGIDGQKITFRILNDASHSVTLATGANNFSFGTDITSYTNSVSLTDYIGAIWNSASSRWNVVSLIQGF